MAFSELIAALKVYVGEYDFAVDGGVVGTITLRAGAGSQGPIPNGSVILGGYLETLTALSGGTSTGALQSEAAGDIVAQAATTGAPWSTTGQKSIIPAFTGATSVKTTAQRSPAFVIGTANLTQGKLRLVLIYR